MAGKMVRCAEGHFYDSEKHASCPWCAPAAGKDSDPGGAGRTRPIPDLASKPIADPAAHKPAAPNPPRPEVAANVTKPLDLGARGTRPVVGWVVCIDGPDKGRDFRLHPEKNFIGRDSSMDISLAGDEAVSRSKHAIVVFDPKKRNFWLYPGDAQGLVYLKEELVNSPVQVGPYDTIEVGSSKLVLVPFDTERYPL